MRSIFTIFLSIIFLTACQHHPRQTTNEKPVQGWNILSNDERIAEEVIARAKDYNINHLQLSHSIVMDLKDVKDSTVAAKVNRLSTLAHEKDISEVTIWDHSLYRLSYYPDKFKTGPDGTINLDNPEFWTWIKEDYRGMLNRVPGIDGIILTFIETGAHVEDQYSKLMTTEEEKLAAMVDSLASVIIDEFGKSLYVRTFIYTRSELGSLLKAINLIKNPEVRVMTKETPHDFFLTHPVSSFVKDIKAPVLIEFDCAHEYNGQGIIASIFPKIHLERFKYYSNLPNVIGYVARTDRFKNTSIIHTPSEINLFALHTYSERGNETDTEDIYDEFITTNYGKESLEYLKPAFKLAPEIILSSLYTLGLPLNTHSRLDIENDAAYQRHVSGKWLDNMNITLNRGVDTSLHYWKDIVNHLAPEWYKGSESNQLSHESQWVLDSNWLDTSDLMNEAYLDMIIQEKEYGVAKAQEALDLVKKASDYVENRQLYDSCLHIFERTLLTARLHKETASVYFAYRVYYKDESGNNDRVLKIIENSLVNLAGIINEILEYPWSGPEGQYKWRNDAYRAMKLYLEFQSFDGNYKTPYTHNTFRRIDYHGLSGKEKAELYKSCMNDLTEKN